MNPNPTYKTLAHNRDLIKRNPRLRSAIDEHYKINENIYDKQPLFYKTILQEPRFNIVLSVCCLIFGAQATQVSDIKELCMQYGIASSNSVIAVITLLRATNRITTVRDIKDRRKTIIKPTKKGLEELKRYMSCAFIPFGTLYPNSGINLKLLDNDTLRCNFFRRVSDYLFSGMTFKKTLPEVEIFIDRDGGRMIMLYIYLEAIKHKTKNICLIDYSASFFAKKFYVSRIHVNRIIKEAQGLGYLELCKDKQLAVHSSFIELVENYAGTYFSYVAHYLDISPHEG